MVDGNLTISDWKSTIRDYAAIHEDYRDLKPWYGRETADIVYSDIGAWFTKELVDYEFLPDNTVYDYRVPPTYYIEVKTTIGECDSVFFMSKAQVQRVSLFRS